jgi:uncharacterized protein with HEPN domain
LPTRRPLHRYNDIIYNIDAIRRYTDGMDEATFLADTKTQDATLHCLLRLSEASRKLGPLAEKLAPEQPWQAIRELGSVLRHDYEDIHLPKIWAVVSTDLVPLRAACEQSIARIHKGLEAEHAQERPRGRDEDGGRER